MKTCTSFFQKFDLFSVTFTPSLKPLEKSPTYSSFLGGITSVIILALGVIFSSNLLSKWFGNELIMKISSQDRFYNQSTYVEKYKQGQIQNLFQISVNNPDLDPFQENQIIILPLMINITSYEIANVLYTHNPINKSLDIQFFDNLMFFPYYLIFVKCIGNEQFLFTGQKCASEQEVNDFFKIYGQEIDVVVSTFTMDVYTQQVNEYISYTSMFIQNNIITDQTLLMQYAYYEIRTGQFFSETTSTYMLQTDYYVSSLACEPGFQEKGLMHFLSDQTININNVVGSFYFATRINMNHIIAEYPSISEMLASIGSTFQTMLLIRYVLLAFNRSRMISEFKEYCRNLYFPELKNITMVKKGKKKAVFLGKQELDKKSYTQFLKHIDKRIDQKMNFANLIYEIYRIESVLQNYVTTNISNVHLKSKLQLKCDENTKLYQIQNKCKSITIGYDKYELSPKIDPFIFNYPLYKYSSLKSQIKNQKVLYFQRQLDELFSEEEIHEDLRNMPVSESMRPQQSI